MKQQRRRLLICCLSVWIVLLGCGTSDAFHIVMPPQTTTTTTGGITARRHAYSVTTITLRASNDSSTGKTPSAVITADDVDFTFDVGSGGVRLAEESAILLRGLVKHKPGKADAGLEELKRYKSLSTVLENNVQNTLQSMHGKIICVGRGMELYKDPGETTEKHVTLAPLDAVRDAFFGAAPALDCDRIVINVLGGDDLQVMEVLEAIQSLVLMLDIATKASVSFNSLSHSSIPSGTVTLTVVGFTKGNESPSDDNQGDNTKGLEGEEKAIAEGTVFFQEGQYYTVVESDLNTAVA